MTREEALAWQKAVHERIDAAEEVYEALSDKLGTRDKQYLYYRGCKKGYFEPLTHEDFEEARAAAEAGEREARKALYDTYASDKTLDPAFLKLLAQWKAEVEPGWQEENRQRNAALAELEAAMAEIGFDDTDPDYPCIRNRERPQGRLQRLLDAIKKCFQRG